LVKKDWTRLDLSASLSQDMETLVVFNRMPQKRAKSFFNRHRIAPAPDTTAREIRNIDGARGLSKFNNNLRTAFWLLVGRPRSCRHTVGVGEQMLASPRGILFKQANATKGLPDLTGLAQATLFTQGQRFFVILLTVGRNVWPHCSATSSRLNHKNIKT